MSTKNTDGSAGKSPYTKGADQASAILALLGGVAAAGLGALVVRTVKENSAIRRRSLEALRLPQE
jgi:hypothetical protein